MLSSCEFIRRNENILFVGPTGVGKTFLSKAIAHEACTKGMSVLFTRTMKMLKNIYSGNADNSVNKENETVYQTGFTHSR